jgi:hypothetical protein
VENFSRAKFLQNSFNGESITETAARFAEMDQSNGASRPRVLLRRKVVSLPTLDAAVWRTKNGPLHAARRRFKTRRAHKAGVAELADALDSKSSILKRVCGFESLLRHYSCLHGRRAFSCRRNFGR